MNCNHVQELLPLYVGGDLEEKRMHAVRSHVQTCSQCGAAADEYRESVQLVQQFAPPPFDAAVYDGIRQRVLREIRSESSAPALPQLVASLFRPRFTWAVATALLLIVSMFALYFVANRSDNQPRLAGDQRVDPVTPAGESNVQPQDRSALSSPSPSHPRNGIEVANPNPNTVANTTSPGSINSLHQPQRRRNYVANRAQPLQVNNTVNTPGPTAMTAEASTAPNNPGEPNGPLRDPANPKTMRVEMQTRDGNIRIIWFSPQHTKQGSPAKSSKVIQEVRSYA